DAVVSMAVRTVRAVTVDTATGSRAEVTTAAASTLDTVEPSTAAKQAAISIANASRVRAARASRPVASAMAARAASHRKPVPGSPDPSAVVVRRDTNVPTNASAKKYANA